MIEKLIKLTLHVILLVKPGFNGAWVGWGEND